MTFLSKLGRTPRSMTGAVFPQTHGSSPKEVAYPVVEPRALSAAGGNRSFLSPAPPIGRIR